MSGKREGKRVEEKKGGGIAEGLLKGVLVSCVVMAVALMAGAGAISGGALGQEMMERWGMVSCVAGALAGGMVSVRKERSWAIPLGMGTGGILFVLLLVTALMLYGIPPTVMELIPPLLSCLCGGAVAGILGRKGKKKRKR